MYFVLEQTLFDLWVKKSLKKEEILMFFKLRKQAKHSSLPLAKTTHKHKLLQLRPVLRKLMQEIEDMISKKEREYFKIHKQLSSTVVDERLDMQQRTLMHFIQSV